MKCPDCKKDLNVTEQSNSFLFQCNFCGLKETIFVTDKTEAYNQLVDSKQSRRELAKHLKKRKEENLFPVPRKTKEEKRKLIQDGGYDPQKIPSAIKNIINNPDIELIYYSFLEQKFPKQSLKKMEFPEKLSTFLSKNNLPFLYEFQQEAFDLIDKGEDIVIVAPTGTGKTEAFILPVLTQIWNEASHPLQRRGISALIIYPTKALAKDQEKKIKKYGNPLGITCEVYDGDTPKTKREKILESPPDILITNPDMLHYHMRNLPFVSIIRNLKFIIIDEIHVAIGAFGSNLYFILKRLQRLVSNKIQFIGSSATIGNALDFSSQLFDRKVTAIIVEEARKAPTHLLITIPWNVSQYTITSEITRQLVTSGHKTLCFQNSHKNAEIINLLLRSARIKSAVHRAGLTRQYRNKVEQRFREGDLDALVSTPTLELGIDIGDVDGVVSSIVNITRFIQRLGRAGRKGQESIGSLILRNDDPISTFYSVYPETYFADIRQGYVEPKNEIVSYYQLLAAVLEKPIEQKEFTEHKTMLTQLESEEKLLKTADGGYKAKSRTDILRLLRAYSIRGIGDTLLLKDKTGKRLGERSMPMAARELHPGAIYLHGGKHYRSSTFKYDNRFGG
ncbi:MAG: DEAD/DEAH box helicase, partial [Candidatus Heimdallarchaeaceae archaeon]